MRASSAGTSALAASRRFSAAAMTGGGFRFLARFLEIGFGLFDFGLCLCSEVVRYEGPSVREVRFYRQRTPVRSSDPVLPKNCGIAGWSVTDWYRGCFHSRERSGRSGWRRRHRRRAEVRPCHVGFTGNPIGPNIMRLEERAETVIVCMRNRIVLVRVAPRALHRQAEKCAGRIVDRVLQPHVAVEHVPVAAPGSRWRANTFGIGWRDFVACEHLRDHLRIRLVLIQGLDRPVAPAPNVPLRVAHLVLNAPAVPIGVAPDVQPVPAPAFAVAWTRQQPVDNLVVCCADSCRPRTARTSSGVGGRPIRSR